MTDVSKFVMDVSNYRQGLRRFVHNMIVYGTGIMKGVLV